MESKHLMH